MKLVKLDDVLELIEGSMADLESNYENSKLQEEIKRLPTVDAVEVVRCRDCKYWVYPNTCGFETITRYELDFCSMGERKEDE